jgi:ferric-dicitrate binding protein FerR (iron transport regulator)
MVPENIKEIADKFLNGTATEEEAAQLHQWYDAWVDEETIIQADTEDAAIIEARMLSRMLEQIREKDPSSSPVVTLPKRRWWKVAVAAAVIIMLGFTLFLWQQKYTHKTNSTLAATDTISTIKPGIDKALLILADGRQVVLDTTATGIVSKQGNTTIINGNGQLSYAGTDGQQEETTYYNTVKTGSGNQYQLVLPDGSHVWLNAASTLRFPTRFNGKERVVELTGEGYFEVATLRLRSGQKMPFKINVNDKAEVEVLGTHFNINAYDDEDAIKTTLLEGSVKVQAAIGNRQSAILKPGKQAVLIADSRFTIADADVEQVVAWKNGFFQFSDAPITTVMRQVARWYNVEVAYQGNVQQEIFSGTIPRSAGITQLIKILELTKTVKVSIEGRKLMIAPY